MKTLLAISFLVLSSASAWAADSSCQDQVASHQARGNEPQTKAVAPKIAGGVYCTSCPPESDQCFNRPTCHPVRNQPGQFEETPSGGAPVPGQSI